MKDDVFVKFNSDEERLTALRKMIGLRQEWENRVSKIVAQRNQMQLAQ